MDMTVYPDFDVDAELDRAYANIDYHKAQVRYYENQVAHLKRARDEQHELQRMYGDRRVTYDVSAVSDPDVGYIADHQVKHDAPVLTSADLDEVDFARYVEDEEPEPGYV